MVFFGITSIQPSSQFLHLSSARLVHRPEWLGEYVHLLSNLTTVHTVLSDILLNFTLLPENYVPTKNTTALKLLSGSLRWQNKWLLFSSFQCIFKSSNILFDAFLFSRQMFKFVIFLDASCPSLGLDHCPSARQVMWLDLVVASCDNNFISLAHISREIQLSLHVIQCDL